MKKYISIIDNSTGNTNIRFCADSKVIPTFGFDKYKEWSQECAVLEIESFMYFNEKFQGYFYNRIK